MLGFAPIGCCPIGALPAAAGGAQSPSFTGSGGVTSGGTLVIAHVIVPTANISGVVTGGGAIAEAKIAGSYTVNNDFFVPSGTSGQLQINGINTISASVAAMYRGSYHGQDLIPLSTSSRTNTLLQTTFPGSGSAPTGWTTFAGGGISTSITSVFGNADGAQAYYQKAVSASERPWFYQVPNLSANTTYCFSVLVESITGGIIGSELVAVVSGPAGMTTSFPSCSANPAGGSGVALRKGVLVVLVTTVGTAGTAVLRLGLGTSSSAIGEVVFSRPQLTISTDRGAFIPTAGSTASLTDYSVTGAGVVTFGETVTGTYSWTGTGANSISASFTGTGGVTSGGSAVVNYADIGIVAGGVASGGTVAKNETKATDQQTNFCLWSQDYSQSVWTKSAASVISGELAPDGSLTAWRLTDDTTTAEHFIRQAFTNMAPGDWTFRQRLKAGTYSVAGFQINMNGVWTRTTFNLSNGTISGDNSGTGTIVPDGNGYYLCSVTRTYTSGLFQCVTNTGSASYLGTGQYVYAWGAELRSDNTGPYTATTSAIVTENTKLISGGVNAKAVVKRVGRRTNWCRNSNNPNSANWSKGSYAYGVGPTAPDGVTSTVLCLANPTADENYNVALCSDMVAGQTAYLKCKVWYPTGYRARVGWFNMYPMPNGNEIRWNTTDGTIIWDGTNQFNVSTVVITNLGGGWWQVEGLAVSPLNATPVYGVYFGMLTSAGGYVTGDGTTIGYAPVQVEVYDDVEHGGPFIFTSGGISTADTPFISGGTVAKAETRVTTGGVTSGGAADFSSVIGGGTINDSFTGAGGVATGGGALATMSLVLQSIGGMALAGAAAVAMALSLNCSGGVATGGTQPLTEIRAASGGVVTGSSAAFAAAYVGIPSGGVTTGGSATFSSGGSQVFTGTGGVTSSGAAAVNYTAIVSSTGGVATGSTAVFNIAFTEFPSGGVTTGSTATFAAAYLGSPAGGVTTGGTQSLTESRAPSGGVVTGGSATFSTGGTQVFVGVGGVTTGGQAIVAPAQIGTGGVTTGSSAAFLGAWTVTPSGGVATGGSVAFFHSGSFTGAGGVTTGGSVALVSAQLGAGGVATGGSATVAMALSTAPSGGVATGGLAPFLGQHFATTSGGVTTSGVAAYSAAYASAPSGGVTTGSSAIVTVSLKVYPSGGVATGGQAIQQSSVILISDPRYYVTPKARNFSATYTVNYVVRPAARVFTASVPASVFTARPKGRNFTGVS